MVINARVLPHVRFNFVDICFVIVMYTYYCTRRYI